MFLEPRLKLVHSKYESKSLGKTEEAKKKLKNYRTLWKTHFENIIVSHLEKTEFDPSRVFDDALEVFMPDGANFTCKDCGKSWYSSKSMLVFVVVMDGSKLTIEKEELGQKCIKCKVHYELPMFNLQYMQDMLEELLTIIFEELYGITDHGIEINFARRIGRTGKGVHDKGLCEACKNGVCKSFSVARRDRKNNKHDDGDTSSRLASLSMAD